MIKSLTSVPRIFWLALLMLIGAMLILWRPQPMPLIADEGWSKWMSGLSWPLLFATVRSYEFHPPVYYSALKLWRLMVGDSIWAMRLPSILAGVALIAVVYRCAQRVNAPPLLAASLIVLHRSLIVPDRLARPYALFDLAVAVATLSVITLSLGQMRRITWLLYLIALEAVLWLHALGMFYAAALALGLLITLKERAQWRMFVTIHLIAGLLYVPCLYLLWLQHQNRGEIWLVFHWLDVIPNLAEGLTGERNPPVLVLMLALVGAGIAAMRARHLSWQACALLIIAVLPIMIEIGISATASPVFLSRYIAASVAPLLILVAASTDFAPVKRIMPIAVGALLLLFAGSTYREVVRPPEERWDAVAQYLKSHVNTGEEVWVVPNDLAIHIGNNGAVTYPIYPLPVPFPPLGDPAKQPNGTLAVPPLDHAHMTQIVAQARARHPTTIWLVSSHPWLLDPNDLRHPALQQIAKHDGADIFISPVTIERWRSR